MTNDILLYSGSTVIALWGVAHVIPTKPIVNGFGKISEQSRRIITMEWIAEGLTLCFIGLLALFITASGWSQSPVAVGVYRACAVMLIVLAGLSSLTGSRTSILPMKICPFVKTAVAALFLLGSTW